MRPRLTELPQPAARLSDEVASDRLEFAAVLDRALKPFHLLDRVQLTGLVGATGDGGASLIFSL